MRYELSAKVEGNARLASNISLARGDVLLEFLRDDSNRLVKVSAGVRIPDNERAKFASTIRPSAEPGVKAHIEIGGDAALNQRLLRELQHLESMLSFLSHNAVTRIRWDDAEYGTVPESDE